MSQRAGQGFESLNIPYKNRVTQEYALMYEAPGSESSALKLKFLHPSPATYVVTCSFEFDAVREVGDGGARIWKFLLLCHLHRPSLPAIMAVDNVANRSRLRMLRIPLRGRI